MTEKQPRPLKGPSNLLFTGSEWTFEKLDRTYRAIEDIALNDLGLNVYPNQLEIIGSEQMLDAYASHAMPLMYRHWSFGKHFAAEEKSYRQGRTGLAYEIVINSSPCISYNMEENTMAMQALVMAHAAFGHNHFFKNNALFLQWTDAEGILPYLEYAKRFVAECEERHGPEEVEKTLDAAHALMSHGVFRYPRPSELTEAEKKDRKVAVRKHQEESYDDVLARTIPGEAERIWASLEDDPDLAERILDGLKLPQENILYFLEKQSPVLENWQREILRIVRFLAEYFYPQRQTKVMNEGCACFVHYYIINELFDRGLIDSGTLLEMLHSHSSVIFQPDFDDPRFRGLNPYTLGFNMMQDIRRICEDPTEEDKEWFPNIAGNSDWRSVLKDIWANYRDESFILQFLSPKLIRDMRLFVLDNDSKDSHFTVENIHNKEGYRSVRRAIAAQHDVSLADPDVQVVNVDLLGDRKLHLRHIIQDEIPLAEKDLERVLHYIRYLWGYGVDLAGVAGEPTQEYYFFETDPEEASDEDEDDNDKSAGFSEGFLGVLRPTQVDVSFNLKSVDEEEQEQQEQRPARFGSEDCLPVGYVRPNRYRTGEIMYNFRFVGLDPCPKW